MPLTYRDHPLDGAEDALVTVMEHSVLGTRWVYDATIDPVYLALVTAAALTGVGQAADLRDAEGRHQTRAATVRVQGGGWEGDGWVPIDGWSRPSPPGGDADQAVVSVLRSPEWELRLVRRVDPSMVGEEGDKTAGGAYRLTGTWSRQPDPLLLAQVTAAVRPR